MMIVKVNFEECERKNLWLISEGTILVLECRHWRRLIVFQCYYIYLFHCYSLYGDFKVWHILFMEGFPSSIHERPSL